MTDKLTLIETIAKNPVLSTFSRVLASSKAKELLTGDGPWTVFAPTDDAFRHIPEDQMNALIQEPGQAKLLALLTYHIVPKKMNTNDFAGVNLATSLAGPTLSFTDQNGIKVNGAGIQGRNFEATNGIVHTLDTVLALPAAATSAA
ncbi:MAG TPA: fasciclin domain-containing protein [Pyrinomonadaceae bacterium]|nr:fasciclin domain-containing protein [Pyrinomonadaceae bacterium]